MLQQEKKQSHSTTNSDVTSDISIVDEFAELSETFNPQELEKLMDLRRREQADYTIPSSDDHAVLKTPSPNLKDFSVGGVTPALGFYRNYLLVRPHPSLRIIFASPELRISGILQQPLMKSVGGSSRVRHDLVRALEMGRKVTAKVQWLSPLSKANECWIHCTPLLGINDSVGVWMVILVNADGDENNFKHREGRPSFRAITIENGSYAGDPIPWETTRREESTAGASNVSWTGGGRNMQNEDQTATKKAKNIGNSLIQDTAQNPRPLIVRSDSAPRAGSQASSTLDGIFSIGGDESRQESVNTRHINHDERRMNCGDRPLSSGSNRIPIQSQLRPTVKIAGRPSFEGKPVRSAPINMPGPQRSTSEGDPDGLRPVRKRTYKSLSPYGIIFDD